MKRHHLDDGIPTLEFALNEFVDSKLAKKLAALTKRKNLPSRKDELAQVIVNHLEGEGLRTTWQCLDPLQQAAVAEVVHSNSSWFEADAFRAKYGREPDFGNADRYAYKPEPSLLGLFFFGGWCMPDDLKSRLKVFVPAPIEAKAKTVTALPAYYNRPFSRWNSKTRSTEIGTEEVALAVHETEQRAQRELLSVLRLVDSGKVSVSDKTRRASAATIETISSVLEGGDYYPRLHVSNKWLDENTGPIRAFAWPLLVQVGGLAQLSGTKLQLTKAGRKALSTKPAETLRTLWTKWLGATIIDELSRIDCVKGQTGNGKRGLTAMAARRGPIAATLAGCPRGAWLSTDEFLRYQWASGNSFMVTRNPSALYLCELQYGSLGGGNCGRLLNERYLYCLLLEYAATLGLIDVALIPPAHARDNYDGLWGADSLVYFSRYDGLMYLRVTALGAYCLGSESAYETPTAEARSVLRISSDFEVAAVGSELDKSDELALDVFANRMLDQVWRLEASRLLTAVEEGRSIEELREFLLARSGGMLPETVEALLDVVDTRCSAIRDCGMALLLECSDSGIASTIASDGRTRKHCMPTGSHHLVVPMNSEAAFRRALRELGYIVAKHQVNPAKTGRPKA
jgi:hypothetical protein